MSRYSIKNPFRLVFILLTLIIINQPVDAQKDESIIINEDYQQALDYLNGEDPAKAIRIFKELLKKNQNDTSVLLGLARSYSQLADHEKALYWIGKVVEQDDIQPGEALIRFYVDELRDAGRYEIAKIWLEKIKLDLLSRNDTLPINKTVMFEDTAYIKATSPSFNSASSDFCPVFYKERLLFYSERNRNTTKPLNLAGDAEADLFAVSILDSEESSTIQNMNKLMGYGHYEGSFAFYNDYQKSILSKYLAGNENLLTGENKLSGLKLYAAEVDTGANIIDFFDPLPFNIHGFSVAHPNISEDGTILYFAANIPGGFGGSDIYRSVFEDGTWGPPENLGPTVNSPYDEYFPYNYNGVSLFFTSNRPSGMGGFDIYKQEIYTLSENQPAVNLGAPINSEGDDFCMIVSPDGRSGYFTSNRPESKGKEDVFRFDLQTVSIEEIIDEILQDDQFENVTVNFDQKHTIIVEPLKSKSDDLKHDLAGVLQNDSSDTKPSTENTPENRPYHGPTIELKIDNVSDHSIVESDITKDDFVIHQQLRLIVRDNDKIIYQAPLPEKLNMSTFFDVKQKVKTAVNALVADMPALQTKTEEKTQSMPTSIFRVQIAASTSPIPMAVLKKRYTGSRDIFEFSEEGWYKYAIGDFDNYFEAARIKKDCGIPDAFIAAYTVEQKVPLMQLLSSSFNSSGTQKTDLNPQQIETIVALNYGFNETLLTEMMKKRIDNMLTILNQDPDLKLLIQGMADYFGSEAYNYALADERANGIRRYLTSHGIRDNRITVVSLGESLKPLEVFDPKQYKANEEASYRKVEVIVYHP